MSSTLVYTTDTATVSRHREAVLTIERIHRALPPRITGTYGGCLLCGCVEVRLDNVTGHRDLSDMGESGCYPVGYGCEMCS